VAKQVYAVSPDNTLFQLDVHRGEAFGIMCEDALRTNRQAYTNAAERIHMLDKRCIRHNCMFSNTYPMLDRNGSVFVPTTVVQLIQETVPYAIINHELYVYVID
ncbi:hypothetical protein LSAT2_027714, partial [Lamellibrachia satsuma]